MMRLKILYLFIATMFFLQSCEQNNPPAETVYRVKEETDVATGVSYTYDYDSQNRLIKEGRSNSFRRNEFIYYSGLIQEDEYLADGTYSYSKIHQINGDGFAVKTTYVGSPEYTTRIFNSNKQRVKETTYDANNIPIQTYDYYYTGELLDSLVSKNNSGTTTYKAVYEYYPDITNTTALQHRGLLIYGYQSSLAIKKVHNYFYDISTGALSSEQEYTYTYEVDSQGRITKITTSGFSSGSATYTYY